MKFIIGLIVSLITLAFFAILLLKIWGVTILSYENISKSLYSLGILAIASIILTLIVSFFFKNNNKGYNKSTKGVAQPKTK